MERSSMHEQRTFANPGTIQILGTKEDIAGIRKADILFSDAIDARWYTALLTAEEYVVHTMNASHDSEHTQNIARGEIDRAPEPPKFVWNGGGVNGEDIKEAYLCYASVMIKTIWCTSKKRHRLSATSYALHELPYHSDDYEY